MKLCLKCNIVKSFEDFHKSKLKVDGYQPYCKDCRKVIDAESYQKSKSRQKSIKDRRVRIKEYNSRLIKRYKRFCGCLVCSENEPIALDLHHIDPFEKDINPSSAVTYSTTFLKREIRKCVVLCANCHRKLHAGLITID